MRLFVIVKTATLLVFLTDILCPTLQADTNSPKLRSFRPVVPIKQNVRGGMDQMKSQTVRLTIPPPPIPDTTAASSSADTEPGEKPSGNLPPEPLKKPEPSSGPTEKSETPEINPAPAPPSPPSTEKESGLPKEEATEKDGPTLARLRAEAHALADQKLTYIFGADDPESGGLDCSATIQYLLNKIGVKDVPRTSYDQYDWLKKNKLLDDVYGKSATEKLFKKLSPGDLIFWGGTWKSGHRVSHVMLYMGYDPTSDKHYIFGARGKSVKGLTGAGVDIFEFEEQKGRLIAHGKIPGLIY